MRRFGLLVAPPPAALADSAQLLLRLVLALIFVVHGWDALNSFGVSGVIQAQRDAGIPLPEIAGPFTVYIELIGGLLLAFGVLTRLIALGLTGLMLGAFFFIHLPNGIFVENGGFEYVLALAAACVVLAVVGPGRFSIDHLLLAREAQNTRLAAGSTA